MPIQIPVTQTGLEASIQAAAQKAGRNLNINLGASAKSINSLSQPLGRITGQADEFTKSMEAANARVLAFGASVGVLNSVVQGFKSLITTTIEVQKSLADINSVLNASSAQMNQFKKDIFNVAKETGNSFKTVSEAALELSRQGLPANEVVGRLKDSMILARLSGLDAAQAVEGLTAAVNSFSKEGLTTSQVLNKISNASAQYAVSERDLIEAFKRSASVAQQAGVSIDELGGIITAVQQKTARGGAVIGNSFKTIFTRIQRPESINLLRDIGVQVVDLEGKLLPATKLIEGLASKINSLSDIESASISEKIGGGFQIAPLLAALDDYSSKASVARGATEAFLSAGNEAYQRNTALNLTLAASINTASVNLKELANTLGEIGVTQNLNNILSFFNTFISDVQDILEGEGLGSDLANGIIKGIGGVLSGPGLAIFGGIILKLTTDLIKFGTESLKTFFNIGNASKEIKSLQGSIASTLLTNKSIQEQILKLEGNRVAQAQFFTTALNTQLSTMERMRTIAAEISPTVYSATATSRAGKSKNAAGGYMPAVSQESRDIGRGVGGARSGDKPVVIPNFAFGGGKRGTMVAHTGEYIVPNFAAGGSAIFNRDMVRSMGLPAGAQKIGAAGGFVPNFVKLPVTSRAFAREQYELGQYTKKGNSYYFSDGSARSEAQMKDVLNVQKSNNIDVASIIGEQLPTVLAPLGSSQPIKTTKKLGLDTLSFSFLGSTLNQGGIDSLEADFEKSFSDQAINDFAQNTALKAARSVAAAVQKDPVSPKDINEIENVKGFTSAVRGAFGGIFDAAVSSALNIKVKNDKNEGDFDIRGLSGKQVEHIKTLFGPAALPKSGLSDFKIGFGGATPSSMVDKTYKEYKGKIDSYIQQRNLKAEAVNKAAIKASMGYIPNFADPLKEAIGREMSAGVPASQIYVDQNSSLKNSMNPMGLMVANRRDEPGGGMQGVSRARREGANPMTYGAASGFVPNYAMKPLSSFGGSDDSMVSLEKSKKDFLGVAFAVQVGLSALSAATSGATNNFLKFTNIISEGLSLGSSITLGAQSIQGLLPATSKFASYLGPAGLAIGGLTAAWKISSDVYNELSGNNKLAADSISKVADAASKAAINLNSLPKYSQKSIEERGRGLVQGAIQVESGSTYRGQEVKLNADVDAKLKDTLQTTATEALAVGASYRIMWNEIQNYAKSGNEITQEEVKKLTETFRGLADEAVKTQETINNLNLKPTEGIGKELVNFANETDFRKALGDKDQFKELRALMPNADLEVQNEQILKIRERLLSIVQSETNSHKELANQISLQLKNTIKQISIESSIRKRLFNEQEGYLKAEYNNSLAVSKINSDITLSDTERSKALKDQELYHSRIISNLEIQREISKQIDSISKEVGSLVVDPDKQAEAIEAVSRKLQQFKETSQFEEIVLDVKLNTLNANELTEVVRKFFGDLAQTEPMLEGLNSNIIEMAKNYGTLSDNSEQEFTYKAKSADLDKKMLDSTKNRSAYLERINLLAENQVAILERQSIIEQGRTAALDINKQIELTQLEKFGGVTSQKELLAKQEAIEDKYFNLRLKAEESSARRQLDIETKRALYTQDNITALMENKDSINQVKSSIDEAKGAITSLPQNIAEATKAAIQTVSLSSSGPNGLSAYERSMTAAGPLNMVSGASGKFAREFDPNIVKNLQGVDERLIRILKETSSTLPPGYSINVTPYGGLNNRATSKNHPAGRAIDIQLYEGGTALKNIGPGPGSKEFAAYESFAIKAREIQKQLYPELNDVFRWGGGFGDVKNDLMHFDIGGGGMSRWAFPDGGRGQGSRTAGTSTQGNIQAATESLSKFEPKIIEAGDRLSSLSGTTELSSKAMEEAAKITSDLSLQNKIATEIQNRANGVNSIALESQAKKEQYSLEKQLRYLEAAPNTFSDGMRKAFLEMDIENEQFAYKLGQEIPKLFSNGISGAIMSAIDGTTSLKEGLRSAAYEFVKTINQRMISNLADRFTSGLGNFGGDIFSAFTKKASGGQITGGSGTKDDVPALLMGGEFVMKKNAVSKYGVDFMDKLNNGKIAKFANGGYVDPLVGLPKEVLARLEMPKQTGPTYEQQTGEGGFFSPGATGKSIVGRENLLAYANQGATSGANDVVKSFDDGAVIGLEDQSVNLTQFALTRDSPINRAIRQDREAALGVYFQDLEREERVKEIIQQVKDQIAAEKEAERQAKKAKKRALRNALIGLAISTVAAPLIGAAGSGFKAAFTGAGGMQNFMPAVGAGLKGVFTGGNLGGVQVGGLNNLFTGIGKGLTGNFSQASNYFKLSQIGSAEQLAAAGANSKSFSSFYGGMADVSGAPRAIPVEPFVSNSGGVSSALGSFRATAYGLASIDPTTAMDQAKADRGVAGYKGFSQTVGASGRKLEAGYSVASNYFPLGTILSINGKEYRVDDTGGMSNNVVDFFAGDDKNLYKQFANLGSINPTVIKRATGGSIPETSGVDTVPTMLSGGEFVVNRAAAQNIGASNLQSLNAGTATVVGGGSNSNDDIISKLNELIEVTKSKENVMVNVSNGPGQDSQNSSSASQQNSPSNTQKILNKKIKDAVIQILENEKRLGGSLRR